MTIKVGDRIPNTTLNYLKDGVQAINTDEIFKGKKVVLFSVPARSHRPVQPNICLATSTSSRTSKRKASTWRASPSTTRSS